MAADKDKLDYIQERIDTVVDRVADVSKSVEAMHASFEYHVRQDEEVRPQLAKLNETLTTNTASLKEHMRRTDLLEEFMRNMNERFSPIEMDLLRKKAVSNWLSIKLKLIAKIGGAIGALGAIGVAVKTILEWLVTN